MRNESQDKNTIHVYMDQSFKAESYFEFVTTQLEAFGLGDKIFTRYWEIGRIE